MSMSDDSASEASRRDHWRQVYETKAVDAVSWFQDDPATSLSLVDACGLAPPASVIDVGGGASRLVDHLIRRGFDVAVLDIADAALQASKARLGDEAAKVEWLAADITTWRPNRTYDLWHDRAVFHFLTDPAGRAAYLAALKAGLRLGGHVIIAAFAEDGPERCSGLPVQRYSADQLAAALGADFRLVDHRRESHRTPWGSEQVFTWALFRRIG